jgi:hypothetical protein
VTPRFDTIARVNQAASRTTTDSTRAYLGAHLAFLLFSALLPVMGQAPPLVRLVLSVVQGTLICVVPILGLVWLRRAWARVPPPCRRAYDGRHIEPNEALWKLFVPVYGIYWLFIANVGLCGAIERHLARGGARSPKAPSTLAFVASVVQLVPLVSVLVSPFVWWVFMSRVDAVQAEAARRDPSPLPPAPLGIAAALGIVVGGAVLQWTVFVIAFLAVWQFLSPAGPHPAP